MELLTHALEVQHRSLTAPLRYLVVNVTARFKLDIILFENCVVYRSQTAGGNIYITIRPPTLEFKELTQRFLLKWFEVYAVNVLLYL